MFGERTERDNTVKCNDKIIHNNKLNVDEYKNFECRQSKFLLERFRGQHNF
jgi:hypothetical protein